MKVEADSIRQAIAAVFIKTGTNSTNIAYYRKQNRYEPQLHEE
jgi:hypothetical protein